MQTCCRFPLNLGQSVETDARWQEKKKIAGSLSDVEEVVRISTPVRNTE
jgi:hypothetical protein